MKRLLLAFFFFVCCFFPLSVSNAIQKNKPLPKLKVRVSHYIPNGNPTYTGGEVVPRKTAAVSPRCKHLLGKRIHIEDYGYRHVNDLTAAWLDNKYSLCTIDVAVNSKEKAIKLGVTEKKITVIKVKKCK